MSLGHAAGPAMIKREASGRKVNAWGRGPPGPSRLRRAGSVHTCTPEAWGWVSWHCAWRRPCGLAQGQQRCHILLPVLTVLMLTCQKASRKAIKAPFKDCWFWEVWADDSASFMVENSSATWLGKGDVYPPWLPRATGPCWDPESRTRLELCDWTQSLGQWYEHGLKLSGQQEVQVCLGETSLEVLRPEAKWGLRMARWALSHHSWVDRTALRMRGAGKPHTLLVGVSVDPRLQKSLLLSHTHTHSVTQWFCSS